MGTRVLTKKPPGEKRLQRERFLLTSWVCKNCKLNWDRNKFHHSIPAWGGRSTVKCTGSLPLCFHSCSVKTENSDCFSVLYFFICHEFFWQENSLSPHYCCPVIFLTPWVKQSQQQKQARTSVCEIKHKAHAVVLFQMNPEVHGCVQKLKISFSFLYEFPQSYHL